MYIYIYIQRAAKLRSRHRAKAKTIKDVESPTQACWTGNFSQKSSKNLPQIFENVSKILPKLSSGEGFGRLGGVLGVSWGVLGCLWVSWGRLGASCGRPWGVLGRPGSKRVANMVPTWSPKRSQNGEKIEAKIDQNFDASWGRIFEGFWWIWEGKMEPSWDQNRPQIPYEHRNAILRKSCSHRCGGVNFLGSGVQVGSKNR